MSEQLDIEVGGQTLRCHFTASKGDPGRTSGPPEKCYPPEPGGSEVEKIELVQHITDDLSPNARATREILLDITDMVEELGGLDIVDQQIDEGYNWEGPPEPEDDDLPEEDDDAR